jgi:branched-chain amino acid transport system substrate-binding protein
MQVLSKRWALLLFAALAAATILVAACKEEKEEGAGTPGAKATAGRTPTGATQGVTDTEIRIGTLLPLSGSPTAAWGVALSKGMKAYFDYINDQGGIYGRKIKFFVEDNQYTGPVALEAAHKLVEQDGVFIVQGSLGTAAHMAVYKYLEEHNIIDYSILTGMSTWTDPVVPTRFCALVDYVTEGRIFAKYIYDNYDGKKIGILAQNDDYGKEGETGIREGLKEQGANIDVVVEYYNEIQSDMTAQVQRLRNDNVDLLVFWGSPVQAGSMFKVSRETLNWHVPVMLNSVSAMDIVAALGGYDNVEGSVTAIFGRQSWETDIPFIAELKQILTQYAPDVKWDSTVYGGMLVSAGTVTTLKGAGRDLTVDSFVASAEAECKYMAETALVPASMSPTDHRPTQAEVMARWVMDRSTDPPTPKWEAFGDVIDFESTKDCKQPTPPAGYFDQPGPSVFLTPTAQ